MYDRLLLWVGHKCVSRNSGLRIGYAFLHWMEQREPKSAYARTNRIQINLIVMEANMSRTEIAPELLEIVAGGALGFDPDGAGTYTMRCEFSGESYPGITLARVMELAQFGASIPNTPEGEQQIIAWAKSKGFI